MRKSINGLRNPLFIIAFLFLFLAACGVQVEPPAVTRVVEVTRPVFVEGARVVTRQIEVTREVAVEVPVEVEVTRLVGGGPAGAPGTAERPFRIVFLPGGIPQLVEVRGGFLRDALAAETGYAFEIVIPADSAEAVDWVCEQPDDTIAFLLPADYAAAAGRCDAQLTHAALRFDVPYRLGMLVALEERVINVFDDLAFKRVGVPSFDDLVTYELFAREVEARGLEGVEFVEYETSSAALIALLNEEIDVAAADYNPPIMPREERVWVYGEDRPEVWREIGIPPERDPIGFVDVAGGPEFGGYRIRDARAALFDDYPEIFDRTRIISLSPQVPNEAVVFGRDFPLAAASRIAPALEAFANTAGCAQSVCAADFYHWDGLQTVEEGLYGVFRVESPES